VNPSDRCQARASGSHWLASGAASENVLLAATSRRTEQRQLLRGVRRPRQHQRAPGRVDARRRRCQVGRAARNERCGNEGGGQHGGVRFLNQDHSGAGRRSRTGRPTTCSTLASVESATSIQPLARAAGTRCGSAPKPRRSSDEAPPWQRGPAGRRVGAERNERREEVMEQAFEAPRGGNISLQEFARAVESATTVPAESAPAPPSDARRASPVARSRDDKTGDGATDRVGVASRCYETTVMTTT